MRDFYAELFRWNLQVLEDANYALIDTGVEGAIGGGIGEAQGPNQVVFYIEVDDPQSYLSGPIEKAGGKTVVLACGFDARGSVDSLGQGHDDSLRPAHVRHAPDVLVLTDAADQAVAVRSQPVNNRLEVVHFEANVAQPQFVRHGVGRSRSWLGRMKLDSSSPVSPSGRRSMTISVRVFGMPMTVSTNSPSTNVLPSTRNPARRRTPSPCRGPRP